MTRSSQGAFLPAFAALALAACLPAEDPEPSGFEGPTGSTAQEIVGGTTDTKPRHLAVAAIYLVDSSRNAFGLCTGTLVTGNWIVTAAHCTWNEDPQDPNYDKPFDDPRTYVVCFTLPGSATPPSDGSRCSNVSEVHRHSSWDDPRSSARTDLFDDIAVLKLSTNAQTAWGITPIPILPASLLASNLIVGASVEFSGFGFTQYPGVTCDPSKDSCGIGSRFRVSAKVDTVCESERCALTISTSSNPAIASPRNFCTLQRRLMSEGGTCTGDSGGPGFLTVNGTEYVVGANSFGDETCQSYGCATNLARFADFLAKYVGSNYPNGHTCSSDMDCTSLQCVGGVCCSTACNADCYSCSTGTCAPSINTPCNDNDLCTVNDRCNGGVCAGTPVDCSASSQRCTSGGTCNTASGYCEDGSPKPNACSTPLDQCHQSPGTCDTKTGGCSYQVLSDGTTCDDGDPSTTGDHCSGGTCIGSRASCPAGSDAACDGSLPSGCGCGAGGASAASVSWMLAVVILVTLRRRGPAIGSPG